MLFKVSASVVARARPLSCFSPQCVWLRVVPVGLWRRIWHDCLDSGFKNLTGKYYVGGVHLHVVVVSVADSSCIKVGV